MPRDPSLPYLLFRAPVPAVRLLVLAVLLLPHASPAAGPGRTVIAQGAESYGPVTPFRTRALRDATPAAAWQPRDPIVEVPRRFYPPPGHGGKQAEGLPDPLIDLQPTALHDRAPTITVDVNIDGQGFTGAFPPDTVGDVGPNHYVQAVNVTRIAIYDKTGTLLPGYPIALSSLAPLGHPCASGAGDPIVLYDWLADRWFLQEFTSGDDLCIYVSASPDPTGSYHFYSFTPPTFPDYPHYGVWTDAYYATTNEAGGGGNQTTYAFDRANMLAGLPATMQRLTAVAPLSGFGFQALTPADHDGANAPPLGAPGLFLRHNDDEAHSLTPNAATDLLELYEMTVDWTTPANTTLSALPPVAVTDFNSWMLNYTTFFSVPQPGSGTQLDPIREVILNRLAYRNFGTHEVLVGNLATNRDPTTTGSNVEAGSRWFELRRNSPADPWGLFQEGTFGGDSSSPDANFFMGSVAMDGQGNIALGYSKTDIGPTPIFPSIGFAGRLAGDPPGTLGPENTAVLGVAPQEGTGRWGDYAAMSIDPADDCTFWYTNEYMPGTSWGTRITSFVFDECLFGFTLTPTPLEQAVCAPADASFDIAVSAIGGWGGAVTLSASGEPPGTSSSFVPNGSTADFTSIYTLTNTAGSVTGTYLIDITGTGDDVPPTVRTRQVRLDLAVAVPGTPSLIAPADDAVDVTLSPSFVWTVPPDAMAYGLEVATDPGFTQIVHAVNGLSAPNHTLAVALDPGRRYYWRVTADNTCGSTVSTAASFDTIAQACVVMNSTKVPRVIPEGGGSSGTTVSTLTLAAGTGIVADVDLLDLAGTHTFMGDLDFFLESPSGTSVLVRSRDCGGVNDFDFNLDDEAAPGPIPCPPTGGGTYPPFDPLSAFDGEDGAGTWTLRIVDVFGGDTGQLDSWSLGICVERGAEIFSDGFESGTAGAWTLAGTPIFYDGFESGTTDAWSSVTPAARGGIPTSSSWSTGAVLPTSSGHADPPHQSREARRLAVQQEPDPEDLGRSP